ncbi:MAG: hypothetical protein KatS3mg086_001 [Candidatus Dojkabacteria bacterium]|nr:MAG: hypothetical protein KatS3mg086_001 [Candidatus Dojkabacteria bacterium]
MQALNAILEYSSFGNKFFNDQEPWKKIKNERDNAKDCIFNCFYILNNLRILLTPMLNKSMQDLSDMLGLDPILAEEGLDKFVPTDINCTKLKLQNISPLFHKVDINAP